MKFHPHILATSVAILLSASAHAQSLTQLSTFTAGTGSRAGSAEILAYTPADNFTVLSTVGDNTGGSFGVQILSMSGTGALSEKGFADFSSIFGAAANWNGASSVAADPLGRGFGAVSLIPSASSTTQGKVAFFDYRGATANGARNLVVLDVGFHPDSVRFSDDGTKLFVANEGESNITVPNPFTTGNAPGSISIIDLTSITGIGNVSSLTNAQVSTFDFQAANLGLGVSLAGLRNHSIAAVGTTGATFIGAVPNFNDPLAFNDPNFYRGIEPEYITQSGNKLFVSLQENNAVGVFDLTSNKWSQIHKLGTISQVIDASDRDGAGGTTAALIDDTVKGLPMPDTIASYTVAGTTYFVTANEGDARPEDPSRDLSRFGDIAGIDSMNNILDLTLFPATQTGVRADGALGRLNVSRLDGDTNGDGKIDDPTMIGTRSFSIWNGTTGALVWDSGDSLLTNLETILLGLDPTLHNMNNGSAANFDTRSDDKGPEPEAISIGEIDGKPYAFVGLERQNGLLMFDISDPTAPFFVDYINSVGSGLTSPESLTFISAADNPTGQPLLLGGYEVTNGIGVYAVPEPTSAALLAAGALGFLSRRRRAA